MRCEWGYTLGFARLCSPSLPSLHPRAIPQSLLSSSIYTSSQIVDFLDVNWTTVGLPDYTITQQHSYIPHLPIQVNSLLEDKTLCGVNGGTMGSALLGSLPPFSLHPTAITK